MTRKTHTVKTFICLMNNNNPKAFFHIQLKSDKYLIIDKIGFLSFHIYISLPCYYIKMGKKVTPDASKLKRLRSKHKEMFPELATHLQEIVQRHAEVRRNHQKRVILQDSEEEVELDVLENDNNDLDTICDTVHRLLSKNKVSAKNAFDVPLIDLEQLPDFMGSLENQYAWKKLSSTLENDYKIYAYRVDAIHSITYNILHTMSRRQQDIEALQNQTVQPLEETQQAQPKPGSDGAEGEHLQRKIQNLNLTDFDLAFGVDPILQRNKRKFDQLEAQNMLINSLSMDDQLALELVRDSNTVKKFPPWGDYADIWKADDPLMAFIELANFRSQINEAFDGKMREEQVFNLFSDEKENFYDENYRNMEIERQTMSKQKDIAMEIKWRNKHTKEIDIIVDEADNWMEERAAFLKKSKTETFPKIEARTENPEDLVNFQLNVGAEEDTRDSIFLKENEKAEFKEEIQDKFLLAKMLTSNFQISKYPLTLKENPKPVEVNIARPNVDIDVRRQLISISQAKKKMKELIHSRSTFKTLYGGYKQFDDISPALCFLTMLHLANENGLILDQIDDTNFYIR